MPTVPLMRLADWRGVQLPNVLEVDVRPLTRGQQALAQGLADVADAAMAGSELASRLKERQRREQEMALVADWRLAQARAWEGTPGDESGQGALRGARDFGPDDGSATEHMRAAWRQWRDDPGGLWAKADPEVRRRAELALRMESESAFIQAARKDVATREQRSQIASEAALGAAEAAAGMHAYDDTAFDASAAQAADQIARVKNARLIVNPNETDAQKLRFYLPAAREAFEGTRAEALERLRKTRAARIIADAGVAESEPAAVARMEMAERVMAQLRPETRLELATALESVKAKRLDGMLGLARAAEDLDERERLADVAAQAAKEYKPSGALQGRLREEVARIKEGAQREENQQALAALVAGDEYEPEQNPRRVRAHEYAAAKLKELRAKEERAQRSAQARELSANAQYVGAMLGSLLWLDAEGKALPVSVSDAHDLLLAQLDAGVIRISDFTTIRAKLAAFEKSGEQERYQRAARLVSDGLGSEIATVWCGGRLELAAAEEKRGDKRLRTYKVPEEETKLERQVDVSRERMLIGGSYMEVDVPVVRDGMVPRTRTIMRKRELLRRDVPRLIELLVNVERADGLWVDLDGNPATPDEKLNGALYARRLVSDLKQGVLAIDLDTQAMAIHDALRRAEQDRQYRTARAMKTAAGLNLPEPGEVGSEVDNDE